MEERAKYYYIDQGNNCAVSLLLAANDVYHLGLEPSVAKMFVGFGGGLQCGRTCGTLTGSLAALSQKYAGSEKYAGREEFGALCKGFVEDFEKAMGCGSIDCSVLKEKYGNPTDRCLATVLLAAKALEEYIAKVEG